MHLIPPPLTVEKHHKKKKLDSFFFLIIDFTICSFFFLFPFSFLYIYESKLNRSFVDDLLQLLRQSPYESEARMIEVCIRMIYGRPSHLFQNHYSYATYPNNINIQWSQFFSDLNTITLDGNRHDSEKNDDEKKKVNFFCLINSLVKKSLYYCRQAEEQQLIGEYKSAAELYLKAFKISQNITHLNNISVTSSNPIDHVSSNNGNGLWLNPLHGAGTCTFMNGEYEKAQELFMKVKSLS